MAFPRTNSVLLEKKCHNRPVEESQTMEESALLCDLGERYQGLGLNGAAKVAYDRAWTAAKNEGGHRVMRPLTLLAELALAQGDGPSGRIYADHLQKLQPSALAG